MLIVPEKNPHASLFYIGAKVLEILKSSDRYYSLTELFDKVVEEKGLNISFIFFMLTLDWLYIINLIDMDNNGLHLI